MITYNEPDLFDFSNLKNIPHLAAGAPDVMKVFRSWTKLRWRWMSFPKNKVLIANPVALTTQCGYRLEVLRKAAATEQEITKTAFVAVALLSHTARI